MDPLTEIKVHYDSSAASYMYTSILYSWSAPIH
jgi:hypothetical protein